MKLDNVADQAANTAEEIMNVRDKQITVEQNSEAEAKASAE